MSLIETSSTVEEPVSPVINVSCVSSRSIKFSLVPIHSVFMVYWNKLDKYGDPDIGIYVKVSETEATEVATAQTTTIDGDRLVGAAINREILFRIKSLTETHI